MNQRPAHSSVGRETAPFDAYLAWLQIPAERRPPNHYELLGLPDLEVDAGKIEQAALDRMAIVRRYQLGEHGDTARQLMAELSRAFDCLTVPERKLGYDHTLHQKLPHGPPSVAVAAPPPSVPLPPPQLAPQVLAPVPIVPQPAAPQSGLTPAAPISDSPQRRVIRHKRPSAARWGGSLTIAATIVACGTIWLLYGNQDRQPIGPTDTPQPVPVRELDPSGITPTQPLPFPRPLRADGPDDADGVKLDAAPPTSTPPAAMPAVVTPPAPLPPVAAAPPAVQPMPPVPQNALQTQIFSSLVVVKAAGDKRSPLGVVTEFGVCTVMPGSFTEVELTTLGSTRTFAGLVAARGPFPFCWIESTTLDLPRARLADSPLTDPQDVFVVVNAKESPELQPARWDGKRIQFDGTTTVNQSPVFNAAGECVGLCLRLGADKALRMYTIRRK